MELAGGNDAGGFGATLLEHIMNLLKFVFNFKVVNRTQAFPMQKSPDHFAARYDGLFVYEFFALTGRVAM